MTKSLGQAFSKACGVQRAAPLVARRNGRNLSPVTESGEYENPIKGVSFGKGPLDAGLFQ